MWFGQSTYVHKGDEKSTINMRVQNTEGNNLINSLGIHERFSVLRHKFCKGDYGEEKQVVED